MICPSLPASSALSLTAAAADNAPQRLVLGLARVERKREVVGRLAQIGDDATRLGRLCVCVHESMGGEMHERRDARLMGKADIKSHSLISENAIGNSIRNDFAVKA